MGFGIPNVNQIQDILTRRAFQYLDAKLDVPAASLSGSVSMPGTTGLGAIAKIALNTVVLDTHGFWDTTNARFSPTIEGRYLVTGFFTASALPVAADNVAALFIAKNGGGVVGVHEVTSTVVGPLMSITAQVRLNGLGDFCELYGGVSRTAGTGTTITGAESLQIVRVGSANF